jgi:hypothetical protein
MRRIVLGAATTLALTFSAVGQSEQMSVVQIPRQGGRIIFVHKPTTHNMQCPTINANNTTPLVAQRLGRTIFAEALVHSSNAVGYVFLISYSHGPHEVYFSSYTQRDCFLDESQSHKRVFLGDTRFDEAKAYYLSLINELSD